MYLISTDIYRRRLVSSEQYIIEKNVRIIVIIFISDRSFP